MEKEYCTDCGIELNEGEAKTFTVCDDCWNHHYKKMQMKPNQTEGSTGVEKDLRLLVNRICSRAYLDSNEEIGKWIQAYADAEKSACLAALKELIPIAEEKYRITREDKSAIERAKKLAP